MNALVVLVAMLAGLVHAAPESYPAWHGPYATPKVLPSGFLADTPEVAALKAVHTAALGPAPAAYAPAAYAPAAYAPAAYAPAAYVPEYAAPAEEYTPKWHGPLAVPKVLPSGFLADTPEVAALKAAHTSSLGHGDYYYH